jgi:predicted enzyme related to lactoylglutathione lyase
VSALVIFTVNVRRLATFYQRVLEATAVTESSGDVRLIAAGEEILVHSIPKTIATGISISTPPVPRDNAALKPVFEVLSLSSTLRRVEENGGVVTDRTFRLEGLTRHDILDPDGNVIQLRSPAEPASRRDSGAKQTEER